MQSVKGMSVSADALSAVVKPQVVGAFGKVPHAKGALMIQARNSFGSRLEIEPQGRSAHCRAHARSPQGASAQFAANILPIIRDVQAAGFTSLNAIAGQLNARKVATANGGQWRHAQVRQILGRAIGHTAG